MGPGGACLLLFTRPLKYAPVRLALLVNHREALLAGPAWADHFTTTMSAQQNQFNDLLDGLEGSLFDADPFSSPTKPAPQQQQAPCSSPRGPPVPRNSTPSKISQKNPNIYQTPSKKKQKVKHVAIGPSSPPPQKPTTTAAAADKENIAELLGGLDDWDDSALDLLSSPSSNNKSAGIDQPQPAKRVPISRQYLRFAVVHVEEGSHPTNRKPCKVSSRT